MVSGFAWDLRQAVDKNQQVRRVLQSPGQLAFSFNANVSSVSGVSLGLTLEESR